MSTLEGRGFYLLMKDLCSGGNTKVCGKLIPAMRQLEKEIPELRHQRRTIPKRKVTP